MTRGVAPAAGRPSRRERAAREGPEGAIVRALAHATRRRILLLLAQRPLAVHAIADRFSVSRPMISKHLKRLHAAGLVASTASGRERIYELRRTPQTRLALRIATADAEYGAALGRLREHLEK